MKKIRRKKIKNLKTQEIISTINDELESRVDEIKLDNGILGKWSFVNKNYEMLKNVELIAKAKRFAIIKKFFKQKLALFGFILFIVILLLALIMPPFLVDPNATNNNTGIAAFSKKHILGTDSTGRDIWSVFWSGLRFSLGIASIVVLIDLILGFTFGSLMALFPIVDAIGQFIMKIFTSLPSLIILVLLALVLTPSFWTIVLGLSLTSWIGIANHVRSYVIRTRRKTQDWVFASKILATSKSKMLFKKMIPHLIPTLITQLIFTIPGALIADMSLSILNLSVQNTATLGSLIVQSIQFPVQNIIPLLTIITLLASTQFIALGMKKAVGRRW